MVKADLVAKIAEAFPKLTKKEAKELIDVVFKTVEDSLANGNDVLITGFGKFTVKKLKARKQQIPGSDKIVDVPERNVARFRPGKGLKEAVR